MQQMKAPAIVQHGSHLDLREGARVKVEIPEFNVRFGCAEEYPQGGVGYVTRASDHQPVVDRQRLVHVTLNVPFMRMNGKKRVGLEKVMWIPAWLLTSAN